MRNILLLSFLSIFGLHTAFSAEGGVWMTDFEAAQAKAAAEQKPMLLDFTGSDWCGWCIKLHDEVFQHDTWMESAQKDYILVALDFPRAEEIKAKVPNPERNEELQAKYGISLADSWTGAALKYSYEACADPWSAPQAQEVVDYSPQTFSQVILHAYLAWHGAVGWC